MTTVTPDQFNHMLNTILTKLDQHVERIEIKDIPERDFHKLIKAISHDIIITHFRHISPTMYEINDSLVYYDINIVYGDKKLPST